MDAWCSLWFWPLDWANELPSRDAWLASLELLLAHGGNFECRSTIHPALHDETTLRQLAATLAGHGVRHYAWQLLRPGPQLPQPFAPIAAGWPQAGLQQQVVAF